MQADVLVLDHDALGLERARYVERLVPVRRRSAQPRAQIVLGAVDREGDAIRRADVDAGIAFDAQAGREDRLDIAVEAALGFGIGERPVEAELDLDLDILERYR